MKKLLFTTSFLFIVHLLNGQVKIGTNPTTVAPSAILEMESTSQGMLIPRMTSANRDAITTPANGLLIFNVTNNGFEVFKSSCSCWVTINDQGSTPASSVVNTAPVATFTGYSGNFITGQTINLQYTYTDGQGDTEGLTTITWQRATSNTGAGLVNISGVSGTTYTLQPADIGLFIRATILPRASTGVLNGITINGSWMQVDNSTIPTANNLIVQGTTAVGSTLTSSYSFTGGNGIENTDPLTGTTYVWQSATNTSGNGAGNVSLYNSSMFTTTYTPQSDLLGRYIRIGARAKDANGLQATNFAFSPWVGPITAATEVAPVVSNVAYSPSPSVGVVHSASYTYFDTNYDPEGASIYQWYRADDASGSGAVAISGANTMTYTGQSLDAGKFIGFGVTPVALTGTTLGTEVRFFNSSATTSAASFTFTASAIKQLPFFSLYKTMNAQNSIQVEVNVSSAGGMSISSPIVNGYSFVGNFTLNTGIQWITLQATGFQNAFSATGNDFTLTGVGTTTETKSINIYHSKKGSDYTAHFNGFVSGANVDNTLASYTSGETFNNNSFCFNSIISTSSCSGSVTGASGTVYPVVNINGQCWMTRNLNEVPSNFASFATNSWLATTIQDIGQSGYYNTATPAGTAGWASTASTIEHGRLYQWSAAMNGSLIERAQGACPDGWHIPSDCEWRYLEHGIGMSIAQTNTQQNHAGAVSQKLRNTPANGGGTGGVAGTNSSGFSMVLVGARGDNGVFGGNTSSSSIWTSSIYNINAAGTANHRQYSTATTRFWEAWKNNRTCSVRCLKD
jgi:uncharacterized protein (TIGR02145 family)